MRMAEEEALMCYQATMRIARQWLCSGLITAEDYENYESPRPSSSAPGLWDKKSQSSGHRDQMCGHTPGKVAGRQETVKAEMNGLTPGLDRSPPPRWMGGQGGQSLKVFGRTRSFWGLSSPKIEMGGKALKWLSRLDISEKIGISRQTYNAIENGKKKLNWTVFLALFAVFSSDERTLKMLDSMEVFQEGVAKEM